MRHGTLLGVLAVALPGLALATPVVAPSPGGLVFTGPTSPHVSAIFWNAAATGLMQGHHVMVLGTASLDLTTIDRARIRTTDGEPDGSGDRSFDSQRDLYVTPGALVGLVSDLGTANFAVGVAGVLAFADRVPELDESLGYHSLGGARYGETTTFAASYRSGTVYLGVGVSLLFSKVDMSFLRDTALDGCSAAPCGVESAAAAQRWTLKSDWDAVPGISFNPVVSYNGGALFKALGWWWGLSVVFPSGIDGEVSKEARLSVAPAGGGDPVEARARVTYNVPWFVNFGMRRPVARSLDLILNGSFARLGLAQTVDLRVLGQPARDAGLPEWVVRHQGLRDVVTVEAGIEQAPARRVRLGARLRFRTSALSSANVTPEYFDAPELTLAGGLELHVLGRLGFTFGYALGLQLPVHVDPSRYSPADAIACNASGHDLDTAACLASRDGRAIPTAAGSYSRISNQVTFGLAYDIW